MHEGWHSEVRRIRRYVTLPVRLCRRDAPADRIFLSGYVTNIAVYANSSLDRRYCDHRSFAAPSTSLAASHRCVASISLVQPLEELTRDWGDSGAWWWQSGDLGQYRGQDR